MVKFLNRFFGLEQAKTDVRTEVVAGVVTFITMAYIIVVNPAILSACGMPKEASMAATILSAFFGTLLMSLYAKRPFAQAPYMGENAFLAFTVVNVLGYTWQTALGAVFIGGVLFTILTLAGLRKWLGEAIPLSLKYSFAVGIGLFITFIGLNEAGIVTLGVPGAPVKVGKLTSSEGLVAIFTFICIGILMVRKIKGAILLGILGGTLFSFLLGVARPPEKWISLPPSPGPVFLKLNIASALSWGLFSVILTLFVLDFVDTLGTLIGCSARAGLLDENGNLPDIEKPMLADSLATVFGALAGTSTTGTYVESAAGIEEGGRTGLTSLVVAFLFLLALFFAPFFTSVPPQAYGPALVIVGLLMLSPVTKINFSDYTEVIPAFSTVILMCFTYNIGIGMTGGFVLYPLFKIISGRAKEVKSGLWVLGTFSLLFFIFYPY